MNEVSTCGKLGRKHIRFLMFQTASMGLLCCVIRALEYFFFSSEVFSKAFDREFWANGSSKQKLLTALVWTVT